MFFHFLKIIFDISTSKWSKYQKHIHLKCKKKIQILAKPLLERNAKRRPSLDFPRSIVPISQCCWIIKLALLSNLSMPMHIASNSKTPMHVVSHANSVFRLVLEYHIIQIYRQPLVPIMLILSISLALSISIVSRCVIPGMFLLVFP